MALDCRGEGRTKEKLMRKKLTAGSPKIYKEKNNSQAKKYLDCESALKSSLKASSHNFNCGVKIS
jgi:hypothetical protein